MSATRDIKVSITGDVRKLVTPPGAYIAPGTKVGMNSHIDRNVFIAPNVTIGKNCIIQPGAVIGSDGFGFEKVDGRWTRKPQAHGVVIGDNVEVGANVCIDRGSWRPTIIGDGTKIDNLVHIAHNVQIGEHCLVIALAEVSGSVEVGDGVWIGPSACIREHLSIGADALVGIGAVVLQNVPAGETWVGNPARRLR